MVLKKAIGKMQEVSKDEGRTVLFVSHNLESIKMLCTRSILMKNGQIVKKTQRIANSTLKRLNLFAKKYDVSRDVLVQTTFLVLKESEVSQIKAKRDVHTKALKEIDSHVKLSEKTKKKLQTLIGRNDSIYNRFDSIITKLKNLSKDISLELNEGKPINPEQ